ncbi:MAG: helix-turn-helix domain-containing protein [Deltaproteobacteria bacterium]|nr:helix-turn-helix domain-containing protein [Deltaproteobacteria bacterium]
MSKRKIRVAFGDDIKKRFTFNEAQAFFDLMDLDLPSGEAVSILKKLVDSFGEVVKHNELDKNSNPSNASDTLKGRILTIKKSLIRNKIPCKIESKRGVGYVLQNK